MTILVAASERTASRVADVLSDRDVRVTSTVADARDHLADEPTLVLVSAHLPDGAGTDLLAAVRSGENGPPETPVLELVALDDADAEANPDGANTGPGDNGDENSVPSEIGTTTAFDDRVSRTDPDALRKAVRLAVIVREYRRATTALYDLSRRRSDGDPIDPDELDDARRVANDRLTAVQRAADGRTPFRRLLSE